MDTRGRERQTGANGISVEVARGERVEINFRRSNDRDTQCRRQDF